MNCNCEGDGIQSFIDHQNQQHDDNLSGLKIIWADIIRWIREKGYVPTLKELIKPIFVGILTLNHEGTSEEHIFFNKEKFDESVDTATRWEQEVENASYDTQTSISEIYIDIIERGPINEFFINNLPANSITCGTHEYITLTREQIDTLYKEDYIFANNDDTHENSSDFNNGRKVVNPENYEEFKMFITNSIKDLKSAEDINKFITEELNVEFEEELNVRISTSTTEPTIAVFISKHKWVPRAGISSPIPGDNQIFSSVQKMLGAVKRHYKLHNKGPIDRNTLYYYPIIGEGKWRIKVEDEEKPRIENPPFICCFHDCDYHCSSEKQRFEHQKNGIHINAQQRTPDAGPFWMATIDYVNKHDQLPTIETILAERESFVCEECGSCFADVNAVSQHLFKKHGITNTRTTG